MDYEEIKEQVKKDIELQEKKVLDWLMHIPRNPRCLGILEQATINGKPFPRSPVQIKLMEDLLKGKQKPKTSSE